MTFRTHHAVLGGDGIVLIAAIAAAKFPFFNSLLVFLLPVALPRVKGNKDRMPFLWTGSQNITH